MNDYQPQQWDSKVGNGIAWIAGGMVLMNVIVQILHGIGALK